MNKTTAIIIGIIILCFGGLIAWSANSSKEDPIDYEQYNPVSIIAPDENNGEIGDRARGDLDSPVIFVEYGDFQCAGCATSHPKVNTLYEQYGDRVAFIFRNFPIQGHQNARAASAAAESAGLQGYYFDMVSSIYANQATWTYATGASRTDIFVDLFRQIAPEGNADKFRTDMADTKISKKITFDYNIGLNRDKVTGTPSFYINGEFVDLSESTTANDFQTIMQSKLDAALSKHNLPTGPRETTE